MFFASLFIALIFVPIPAFGAQKIFMVPLISMGIFMLVLLFSHPRRLLGYHDWRGTKPTLIFIVPILAQAIILLLQIFIFPSGGPANQAVLYKYSDLAWATNFCLVVFLVPITEELFYRKWMWDDLKAKGVQWGVVPATTILWWLGHWGRPVREMFFLFLIGLVFAMARAISNGIALGLIIHIANNFLVFASVFVVVKYG